MNFNAFLDSDSKVTIGIFGNLTNGLLNLVLFENFKRHTHGAFCMFSVKILKYCVFRPKKWQ